MTPVDTSAEAVERIETDLRRARATMLGTPDENHYWICHEASDLLRALATERADLVAWRKDAGDTLVTLTRERAEQESLLAERNRANAAAFTASDAYQKRCEQGDALLLRISRVYADFGILTTDLRQTIDAHLAGEDMGRKL
jgi:hypothetical protein